MTSQQSERSEQFRLFVACELPEDVRRGLSILQEGLRRETDVALRWVRPEGIHITLKFLGQVDAGRVGEIESALADAMAPFELRLQPAVLGGFGGGRLRVVWVGLEGDIEGLSSLAARVETALAPLGFPEEGRPFAPHLTLARVPDGATAEERRQLTRLLQEHGRPDLPPMVLTVVHLVRSILGRGGAQYQGLATFPRSED